MGAGYRSNLFELTLVKNYLESFEILQVYLIFKK